jgi:hypothetical protein
MKIPIDVDLAKKEIAQAAAEAIKVITQAAGEATKVVVDAATVSAKVLNLKNADDHDLLTRLETKMEGLKEDIKELKDGTTIKIADHEKRLFDLEKSKNSQTILISIGIGILTILVGLLSYHIVK